MSSDRTEWKTAHANLSEEALHHPLVQDALREFAGNMGFDPDRGLPAYGLIKVAATAAQVARAQALGFAPDLLRLTPDESNRLLMERAAALVLAGVPVHVVPIEPT
jgi:hypothetical protein